MLINIRDNIELLLQAEKLSLHVKQAASVEFGKLLEDSQPLVQILSHKFRESGVAILNSLQ